MDKKTAKFAKSGKPESGKTEYPKESTAADKVGNINNIIEGLHPFELKILPHLGAHEDFREIAKASGMDETRAMRALQWLSNKKVLDIISTEKEIVVLGENGKEYSKKGLPERRFLKAIEKEALDFDAIAQKAGLEKEEIGVCLGVLKKKAAIEIKNNLVNLNQNGKNLLEHTTLEEKFLEKLSKGAVEYSALGDEEKYAYLELIKRKDILIKEIIKIKTIRLSEFGKVLAAKKIEATDFIDRLTPEILKNNSWKNKKFRKYDVKINVPNICGGKVHFMNQSIEYIKKIWISLGFKEMSGNMIQTAYWDLDALFVPQDHPARAMQDTFYLGKEKNMFGGLPKDYKKIKETHENGWKTGSTGWGGKWSEEDAKKILLRTHTTVLSAQTISKLKEKDLPAKFFCVSTVFRNEALDWKHLFEFCQVDGIVIDPNANLKHLKGYLREFFGKMGFPDVRMRPAHFPYTEPSVEVEVFHPVKKEWVEFGGAGIFRPEVVIPLLGKDIPVLAWGLGMPRIISGYFGITDIRDLNKNDIKQLREIKMWMK